MDSYPIRKRAKQLVLLLSKQLAQFLSCLTCDLQHPIILKLTQDNNGKYIFAKWWGPFKTKAVSTTEGSKLVSPVTHNSYRDNTPSSTKAPADAALTVSYCHRPPWSTAAGERRGSRGRAPPTAHSLPLVRGCGDVVVVSANHPRPPWLVMVIHYFADHVEGRGFFLAIFAHAPTTTRPLTAVTTAQWLLRRTVATVVLYDHHTTPTTVSLIHCSTHHAPRTVLL